MNISIIENGNIDGKQTTLLATNYLGDVGFVAFLILYAKHGWLPHHLFVLLAYLSRPTLKGPLLVRLTGLIDNHFGEPAKKDLLFF